jgi:hypothetical protein
LCIICTSSWRNSAPNRQNGQEIWHTIVIVSLSCKQDNGSFVQVMRRKPGSLKIESHHELFRLWSTHNDGSAGSPARSWFLFCKCTTQGVKCTSITSSVLHAWAAAVAMCGPNKSCKLNPAYNQEETCLK